MTQGNWILIDGGDCADLRRALRHLIYLNIDQLEDDISFELYDNGASKHIIKVDDRLDNLYFCGLISDLENPEGIEYDINIEGFTTIEDIELFKPEWLNKRILIFISKPDRDPDYVYGITQDNEAMKIDFGGKIENVDIDKRFYEPDTDVIGMTIADTFKVKDLHSDQDEEEIHLAKVEKWFNIVLDVFLILFTINLMSKDNNENFLYFNYLISGGVFTWLFLDYEKLRINRLYVKSFILAIGILTYGYLINNYFYPSDETNFVIFATSSPLVFLLIQRPLRLTFKFILKREPVVESSDCLYGFLLLTVTIAMLILIMLYVAPTMHTVVKNIKSFIHLI